MLTKKNYARGTYAAWLDAAATAHRTADAELKARAERLFTEYKFAERRAATRRARLTRERS